MSTPEPKDPEVVKAEAEKVKAEAESAKIKVRKEEREEREAAESGAKALRDAERRQKIAEAEKATTAATRDQIAALIPDFKDVDRGKLEDKSEKPMFEAALAQRALASAASAIADKARDELKGTGSWRLLITSDTGLAVSDATYHDVVAGLDELTQAAEGALHEPEAKDQATDHPGELLGMLAFAPAAAPVVSAVAAAVPALLGVFSAQRTLRSTDVQKNDLAGAAAVAGFLTTEGDDGTVVHDDFRLLPTDGVHRKHAALVRLRRRLTALKLTLEAEKARTSADDDKAHTRIAVRLGLTEGVSSAIDTFNASLVTVPQDATRSPLGVAATREQLHAGGENDPDAFTHVLLIKSEGGGVYQTIDDKPFLMDDKVSIIATVSVTWILIGAGTSEVVGAGTVGGTATAHGNIGDRFHVAFDDQP